MLNKIILKPNITIANQLYYFYLFTSVIAVPRLRSCRRESAPLLFPVWSALAVPRSRSYRRELAPLLLPATAACISAPTGRGAEIPACLVRWFCPFSLTDRGFKLLCSVFRQRAGRFLRLSDFKSQYFLQKFTQSLILVLSRDINRVTVVGSSFVSFAFGLQSLHKASSRCALSLHIDQNDKNKGFLFNYSSGGSTDSDYGREIVSHFDFLDQLSLLLVKFWSVMKYIFL